MPARAPTLSPLARELHKRRPFESPEQEAMLNLVRTAEHLSGDFDALFKSRGLSGATYNVLRILRGAGAEGRPCHQIGEHMVARVPDVTRLVDRLERAGLAERRRIARDRRVVMIHVTPKGLRVLADLDGPVADLHARQLGHLTRAELAELSRLLAKARRGGPAAGTAPG
jgi:DNA-binding MarR family transcriptional regulator